MNIEGDPAPGWGLAWVSVARGPGKGSLKEFELSTLSFQVALQSPVLCQEALARPLQFSPQHYCAWLPQEVALELDQGPWPCMSVLALDPLLGLGSKAGSCLLPSGALEPLLLSLPLGLACHHSTLFVP